MELIRISQTKLKIMLDRNDMRRLDLEAGNPADISSREAFRNILKEAKARCGFDAVGDRVFVQYYPDKCGGCEMFVTKLTDSSGEPRSGTGEGRRFTHVSNGITERYDSGYIIYSFANLGDLLSTCRMLKNGDYGGESMAYRIKDKCRYYLVLTAESYFAAENGGARCEASYYYVLLEHGELICRDAVGKLANLS